AIFVPNGWYPGVDNFQNKEMVAAYLAKYGGTPDSISSDVAEAFAVGQVVQQAVTKNGGLDNQKLIQELHSDTFQSVQGPVKFDSTGQNTAAQAYLFQWQKGSLIPVYPASLAKASPEYPKVNWPEEDGYDRLISLVHCTNEINRSYPGLSHEETSFHEHHHCSHHYGNTHWRHLCTHGVRTDVDFRCDGHHQHCTGCARGAGRLFELRSGAISEL